MGDLHVALAVEAGAVAGVGALLVVAGVWSATRSWPPRPHGLLAALALGGIGVLWHRSLIGPRASVGLVVVLGIVSLATGRSESSAATLPLAAISLVGVWAAVPDTEAPLIAAVTAVVALVVAAPTRARPTWADRTVAIGLVVLTAALGSAGRAEVVGGIACVGLLVMPIPRRPCRAVARSIVGGHVLLVLIASRGVTRLDLTAALMAVICLLLAAGVFAIGAARSALDCPARDPETS